MSRYEIWLPQRAWEDVLDREDVDRVDQTVEGLDWDVEDVTVLSQAVEDLERVFYRGKMGLLQWQMYMHKSDTHTDDKIRFRKSIKVKPVCWSWCSCPRC